MVDRCRRFQTVRTALIALMTLSTVAFMFLSLCLLWQKPARPDAPLASLQPRLRHAAATAPKCFIQWHSKSASGKCSVKQGIGCDPDGDAPCCSAAGYCGKSDAYCDALQGGIDFRQYKTPGAIPRGFIIDAIAAETAPLKNSNLGNLNAHAISDEWFGSGGAGIIKDVSIATSRCGLDWADANERCGPTCTTSASCSKISHATCFADLSTAPCESASTDTVMAPPYVFRSHVSDRSNLYDAMLMPSVRFSRPADEELDRRPRCGEQFGGRECQHFRCCSVDGYCGDSVDYCTEHELSRNVEQGIFLPRNMTSSKSSFLKLSLTSQPFDSSADIDLSTKSPTLPFFCLGWWTLTTVIVRSQALVWVSGLPLHSYSHRWEEHEAGIQLEDLARLEQRFDLALQITADNLQPYLADLRRTMRPVLRAFAKRRGLVLLEVVRIESWGMRVPTLGIVDAAFTKKKTTKSGKTEYPRTRSYYRERVTLSFDFTVKPDAEVLPRLVLLDQTSNTRPRVVFIIASFARRQHLQRLITQINVLSKHDKGRTTACVAGQTNDPEDISIRTQVAQVATFDPQVIEIHTSDPFNKARNLQACIDTLDPHDIAFVMDVDLRLPKDLPNKARRYTRQGSLVYSPIIWYEPNPSLERTVSDVRTFDHIRLPIAERMEWLQLASAGPGIIAFYASDGKRAGGFDTKTFASHGFEDTDFFFRLKRAGLEFARVVERGLVHHFHKPSVNNHLEKIVPWPTRWEKLQRTKCFDIPAERVLEWYEQGTRVGSQERFFDLEPPEVDYAFKLSTRPLNKAYMDVGPIYVYSKRVCDGVDFCISIRTHATIQRNKERLDATCPSGGWNKSGHKLKKQLPSLPANLKIIAFLSWSKHDAEGGIATSLKAMTSNSSMVKDTKIDKRVISLQHPHVGAFSETGALFRAKIRCGEPFALARYGDGELSLLERRSYKGIDAWSFDPDSDELGARRISELIADGFALAEDYDGMHLGLPFYFCAEGTHDRDRHQILKGGGGNNQWLRDFAPHLHRRIPPRQLVYSWQWSNLNYGPVFEELLSDLRKLSFLTIVICSENIRKTRTASDQLPSWVWSVLTVPDDGVAWFVTHMQEIEHSARALARAVNGVIVLFAAGPLSNMLIPLMTRANRANTYIDVGGTIDWELKGVRSRDFHPKADNPLGTRETNYIRAGGALTAGQTCTETRWELVLSGTDFEKDSANAESAMAETPCPGV